MEKKELVDLCKKGDEQALSLLYNTYSAKMMRICLHYVADRQIAQDLLHDGFIIIFTSINSLRNPEKLESWMGIIMKNISLRYLNQTNSANTISISDVSEDEEPAINPFSPDFISYDKLTEMVERLPEGYCTVFKLAVLEGLSHKEIGRLLNIAPHSSSSQLFRAKTLLKKMIIDYRLMLLLLLLFLVPMLQDYLYYKDRDRKEKHLLKTDIRQKKTKGVQDEKMTVPSEPILNYKDESRLAMDLNSLPPLEPPATPSTGLSELKDSVPGLLPVQPSFSWKPIDKTITFSYSSKKLIVPQKKKAHNWKLMLASSVGPQLAQSMYKLIATPHDDATSGMPQQVDTWEDYYSYLNTRHQEGTLGDSLTLLTIAKNNSGRIIEQQHHDSPVTFGLSVNKNLNNRWSLETGLRYTYLKSTFTTGEEYRIQDTQKLHYIGIPLRVSYRFANYKRFSLYSAVGIQMDIPLKGTLQTTHITDSIPVNLDRQSLHAPLQWSVNGSVGVQYHFTPRTSFYLEPTINYYIPDGSDLRTIRKEHPVTFSIPFGIRFTW